MHGQSILPRHSFPPRLLPPHRPKAAAPVLDWQVYEDENEWRAAMLHPLPPPALPARRHWSLRIVRLLLGVVFVVASAGGVYLLSLAQTGLTRTQQELGLAVEADMWHAAHTPLNIKQAPSDGWKRQIMREAADLQAVSADQPMPADPQLLDLGSTWAVVQVTAQAAPDQPVYRQTRVYVETEGGWVRVPPSPAHWGSPRRLENEHFIVHYYSRDEAAVREAAAMLDALYPAFYTAILGHAPTEAKRVVEVTPAQTPGRLTARDQPGARFISASPGVYLAPDTVSDAELLAQALVLDLLDDLTAQAKTRYAVPSYWQPMLDGLFIWQLWQSGLPLAAWREPLVGLIYTADPYVPPYVPPAYAPALCTQFHIWMAGPLEIGIPLICRDGFPDTFFLRLWDYFIVPPLDRSATAVATRPAGMRTIVGRSVLSGNEMEMTTSPDPYPGSAIAIATALEYINAVYGPEAISALPAALAKHEEWTTLAPAVFGVSATEFDDGWRAYLLDCYGLGSGAP